MLSRGSWALRSGCAHGKLRHSFRACTWLLQEHAVGPSPAALSEPELADTLKVAALVQRFRQRGHLVAQLDPLHRVTYGPWLGDIGKASPWADVGLASLLEGYKQQQTRHAQAAWTASQLQLELPADAERSFYLGDAMLRGNPAGQKWWTLPEVVERMRASYCGSLTAEFDHLPSEKEQTWVAERMERPRWFGPQERRAILRDLVLSDAFETFTAAKFPKNKRFGLSGCEALLPGLQAMVRRCAFQGVERMEVGMPHRGRLNLLCNLLKKPPGILFGEMVQAISEFHVGDVQYHMGESATLTFSRQTSSLEAGGRGQVSIRVSLAPNPSHLEAVNAIVQGMVRAEQTQLGKCSTDKVAGLLIHGDAAFAGLGIVAECLQLSNVPGFTTGGTLHVIINNQLGFTTAPTDARSSPHPTDMAKAVGAPILHVNADDPEAVVRACTIAADWRATFHRDVVVDLVGYRRMGHNELDDPKITLPHSYDIIEQHLPVLDLYAARLEADGLVSATELRGWKEEAQRNFEAEYSAFEQGHYKETPHKWLSSSWQGDALQAVLTPGSPLQSLVQEPTGLPLPTLQWVGEAICRVPTDFQLHPHVASLLQSRKAMVASSSSRVNWAMAEALAFGTLALHRGVMPPNATAADYAPLEGLNRGSYAVRMTGQDVERGTFNQRHYSLVDQLSGRRLVPLNSIIEGAQERVDIFNSPLNEAAVLGFEYGYSLGSAGHALTIWEAQFGDFQCNAQCIIDQFVAAAEERWGQQTGLVLMLPHGLEGQGPDHSSARVERFLQMCSDDPDHLPGNSPAQRRQIAATFAALAREHNGRLDKAQTLGLLSTLRLGESEGQRSEAAEALWTEMGLAEDAFITQEVWDRVMVQYLRRNAESHANMFVVNATTPAQLFHVLRRQMNRPFLKPLVLFTPKFLLHHRPASSALEDFTTGTFFNRIIDDSKASDNTRHLARNQKTGEAYLVQPEQMRRVVLCSGSIYYHLSHARRARKLKDVALVRLEQLAPFPHDLLVKAIQQYKNAEVVWCQEEPKNQGAWRYIKTRLECAMRELLPQDMAVPKLKYIGRTAAASPATASMVIHTAETRRIIDEALD